MATAWHWSSQIHPDRMHGIHSSRTNVISSSASEKMEQVSLSLCVCVCVLLFFSLTSVLALCGQVVFMMKRTWTSFWNWFTKVGIRITSTCLYAMVALKSKKTSRCTHPVHSLLSPLFSLSYFLFWLLQGEHMENFQELFSGRIILSELLMMAKSLQPTGKWSLPLTTYAIDPNSITHSSPHTLYQRSATQSAYVCFVWVVCGRNRSLCLQNIWQLFDADGELPLLSHFDVWRSLCCQASSQQARRFLPSPFLTKEQMQTRREQCRERGRGVKVG